MNHEFIEALEQIGKEKGVSKEILYEAIEAALISAYKKNFNTSPNVNVHIDRETGQIRVYSCLTVVDEVKDPQQEISLEEAREHSSKYQIGDVVEIEVTPKNFGRIAAQTAKQVVIQRIREAEREIIFQEYVDREDDIITGIVQRTDQKNVIIDLGKTEAILPPTEQMPGETYRQRDRIKAYVVEVKKTTKGPQIMVSRTHPGLLKRLFELEVPEIFDGTVEIKTVAREAGQRSKIAVFSRKEEVDSVGSCVGPKGARVQTIVNELKGEKIDIIKYSEDPKEFVSNALSPAKVTSVQIKEEEKVANVIVPDYQLSLAIGKEGQNARLAAKLTGWKIDITCESQVEDQTRELLADEKMSLFAEEEKVLAERQNDKEVEEEVEEREEIEEEEVEEAEEAREDEELEEVTDSELKERDKKKE
ncbi:MAG: transcription termination/antitermination protein NusA [Candidatus Syntrophonatronum acetioxidans]|uniref:Transcription termination/antitermination protein NusA n=1 Tax=Candidatus Syntrophonatronum acetioxidans TaxID=1795816 RepID=A0A424YD74_9FIRM|nr:MAG: transcription termination/antitermination protein NusA [Candidatus Syntrophonatronum acetioxidans]